MVEYIMQKSVTDHGSRTLAEQTFVRLQADLKANRFEPGARLRFQTMTAIYDVGIAPLREALSRLAEYGLVTQEGQKGFRVAEASVSDWLDVVGTRSFLEVKVFEDAIEHGDDVWEGNVVASFHRFSKVCRAKPDTSEQRAVWEERHSDFHRTLVSSCPSPTLLRFWSTAYSLAERYRRLAIEIGHWSDDELRDHEELMNAAIARDVAGASALMKAHIGKSSKRLLTHILPILDNHSDNSKKSASQ